MEVLFRTLGSGTMLGINIKLKRKKYRPGVVLSPGHHVQLSDDRVCLVVAAVQRKFYSNVRECAVVIFLVGYSGQAPVGVPQKKKQKPVESRHPVAGLRWLNQEPLSKMAIIDTADIERRVHVVPAFTVSELGTGEDGFLLNHCIFNYSSRHREVPALPIEGK